MSENGKVAEGEVDEAKALTCHCGGRLFAYMRLLQTNPDGRMMELAASYVAPGFIYFGICLGCSRGWIIPGNPVKDSGCMMYAVTSPKARELIKACLQDFSASFDPDQAA